MVTQFTPIELRIPPLLPVGEIGIPGLHPRRPRRRLVPDRRFDLVQNVEGFPRFGRMAKLAVTLNRPHDFRAGLRRSV